MSFEDKRKAIRDPIHGLVSRKPKEIAIMDTPAFQRLRRIRQLAMAHLLYPGALHTRFDHAVGVMHVAGLICQRLSENQCIRISKEEERMIRLAALLHDIGQGPFSHVSEFLIDRYRNKVALGETEDKGEIHERLTVDIIQKDPEIAKILNKDETKYIADIIKGSRKRNFRRDIVSSSLDADKMDYLLRDSYFCGVKYGQYDLEKIVDSLRVYEYGRESYLVVHHECIYALEQLFLAKYHMTQQVYAHRVRCITDAMIVRGLILAIEDGNKELGKLYSYDGSKKFLKNYLIYHDENVVDLVCSQTDSERAKEIFECLRHRRLFKQVCCFPLGEDANAIARGKLLEFDVGSELQQTLEAAASRELNLHPSKVIVYKRKVKNPTYIPVGYRLDPEETYVLDKNGVPKKLNEFQDLMFSFDKGKDSPDEIHVYASMDNWNKLSDRKKKSLQERLKSAILSSIPTIGS
jgi:HD superfamily phosphohydrolase